MNRLYFWVTLLLTLTLQSPLRAQSIDFQKGAWKDILARAKSENKLIFVDIYTTWCGPCKMLDRQVFTDKDVAATYNTCFINYKIDAERGEGITLARQYSVQAYPTALFIDAEGELVDSWVGFLPAPAFRQEGERVFRKTPIGLVLSLHETAYKAGNRTAAFMKTYLRLRQQAGLSTTDVLNDYVRKLPADSLRTPLVTSILVTHTTAIDGPAFDFLMSRKEEPRFRAAIDVILQNELSSAGKKHNQTQFTALCRLVEQLEPAEQVTERLDQCKLNYHADAEDWQAYAEQARAYTTRHLLPKLTAETKQQQPDQFKERYFQLCNIAYFVSMHSKAESHLASFLALLVPMGELNPTPVNTSLQACLTYRLGKRDEALALQTKALEQARSNGDDVSSYESTLIRMQKKKSL